MYKCRYKTQSPNGEIIPCGKLFPNYPRRCEHESIHRKANDPRVADADTNSKAFTLYRYVAIEDGLRVEKIVGAHPHRHFTCDVCPPPNNKYARATTLRRHRLTAHPNLVAADAEQRLTDGSGSGKNQQQKGNVH